MAVKPHMAQLLDRLAEGKPGEQDWSFSFAKIRDAQVVAHKGSYPGDPVTVYVEFDGIWFQGPQLDRFPDCAGKLLKRGAPLAARQKAWAREKAREERDGATATAKAERAEMMQQLQVVERELEDLRQVGGDRERIAELMQEEDRLCRWIWPARYGAPTVADHAIRDRRRAYPQVEVL